MLKTISGTVERWVEFVKMPNPLVKIIGSLLSICIMLTGAFSFAGSNNGLVYHGRIIQPDGTALNSGTVTYTLQIWGRSDRYWDGAAPQTGAERCLLFQETHSKDMTGSAGAFELLVGEGTGQTWGAGSVAADRQLSKLFVNYPYNSLTNTVTANKIKAISCTNTSASGNIYFPYNDSSSFKEWVDRELVVSINTGSTSFSLPAMAVRSSPFALQAAQVAGYSPYNLFKIDGSSSNVFSADQHDFLWNFSQIKDISGATCANGEILKVTGGAWKCATDDGGAGVVSSVTATSPLNVSGTTTVNVRINNGSTAGETLRWTGAAWNITRLAITDVSGVVPISQGGTGTTVVPTNGQILIGGTSGYVPGAISSGSGINITNASGSITISANNVSPGSVSSTGNANQVAIYSAGGALTGEDQLAVSRGGTGTGVVPTAGQMLIARGDGTYIPANISAGAGININAVSGAVTISAISSPSSISGAGATNYLAMFNTANSIVSSPIYVSGTNIGFGHANPIAPVDVSGGAIQWRGIAADPATASSGNGQIYYNSGSNKFRVSQGGAWADLVGGGATGNISGTGATNYLAIFSGPSTIISAPMYISGNNIAIGPSAGRSLTSADNNIAIGTEALMTNTTQNSNIAIGYQSQRLNAGSYNTSVGSQSMLSATNASSNAAFGIGSLQSLTTGAGNVAMGESSMLGNTTGNYNVAIGQNAGFSTGSASTGNTFLGRGAGYYFNNNSSNNVALGFGAGPTSASAATMNGKLYINNAASNTPLIYGDFTDQYVRIHNSLELPAVGAAPTNPSTGYGRIYAKSDGTLHYLTSAGVDTSLAGGGTGNISGAGTANYVPVFTAASVLGDSPILVSSGNVGIGASVPSSPLDVSGAIRASHSTTQYLSFSHDAFGGSILYNGGNNEMTIGKAGGNRNLYLNSNGGVSVGAGGNTASANGLLVVGDVLFGNSSVESGRIGFTPSTRTIASGNAWTAGQAGYALNLSAGNSGTGTDIAGGNLVLSSGNSTGSAGSDIVFNTASPGASGTTVRTPSSKMTIKGDGSVGIGTTSTTGAKLVVSGTAVSRTNIIAAGATVDLSLGNNHLLKLPGTDQVDLSNMTDGGVYTLIFADTTSRLYQFNGCDNTYFSPANAATTGRSTFTIMVVLDGASKECYITWTSDFN